MAANPVGSKYTKHKYTCRRVTKADEPIIRRGLKKFKPVCAIADELGTTRQTLAKYIKANMAEELESSTEALIDVAEYKLTEKISMGDLGAITFFLDRRARHRGYGVKQELNVEQSVKQPSKEELDAEIERILGRKD